MPCSPVGHRTSAHRPETGASYPACYQRETAPGRWRVTTAEALPTWMSLGDPARLLLVPAALADPAVPPALRDVCARSLRRTTAVVTSRGAAGQGLSVAG